MRLKPALAFIGAIGIVGGAHALAQGAPGGQAPAPAETAEQVKLNCDAISYRGTLDEATVKEMEPIHDLNTVAALLSKKGVVFDRSRGVLTISLPPKARAEIDALPPGEPIVLPSREGGIVCVLMPSPESI